MCFLSKSTALLPHIVRELLANDADLELQVKRSAAFWNSLLCVIDLHELHPVVAFDQLLWHQQTGSDALLVRWLEDGSDDGASGAWPDTAACFFEDRASCPRLPPVSRAALVQLSVRPEPSGQLRWLSPTGILPL